jgi:serine/threonine protein kinase
MATSIFREYFKGYEILGELGRGNARVLKARSLHSGELVAIKHFAFNTDPDTLRRFQRESEIMKSIQHDHVVKIIEVHLDAELPYIVMQLVEGGDLRSLLKLKGSLDVPTVIRLAHHMAEALDAIHAKAVVHRDMKPENIMYRRLPSGEIHFLLTDFGIAKLREQADTITATGASMLTYDYASPEQFNQPKMVSVPTDYYSLGIVIYECLTGTVPFEYEQDNLLMHINRVVCSPMPVPETPDGRLLCPSLLQLLEGLLTKECLNRLSDTVKLRHLLKMAAIEDLQDIRMLVPRTQVYVVPEQTTTAAPSRRRKDITFATLVVLLVSVVIFFSWTTMVKPANAETPKDFTGAGKEPGASTTKPLTGNNTRQHNANAYQRQVSFPVTPDNTVKPPAIEPEVPLSNGIYYNDFSDPRQHLWDVGKDESSEYNLADGKYVMRGLDDSLSYSSTARFHLNTDSDFAISANITQLHGDNGDPFGINFCGNDSEDAYFVFYITSNGFYSIGTLVKGEWNVLVDWTTSSHIRPDTDMNILSVEKQGDELRFLINDKLEKTMPFTGSFGNYFGMRVDGAQTVAFDQLIVKGSQ